MKSVVRAFVFNPEGQILMTKHSADAPWVLPGGHVESGESIHEAMIRELREEFSLEAQFFEMDRDEILRHKGRKLTHHPLPISIYDLEYKNAEWVDKSRTEYVFLMETDGHIWKVQNEEIFAYKWFEVDEILMMKPNIETWDFIIEMLEKIVWEDDEIEE
jgi:8-oxo-dGTP pyrophosphatase MutT (NUDIX family)